MAALRAAVFRYSRKTGGEGIFPPPSSARVNTRTGGGSENHTVWRGWGHIMPPSISAPMRANTSNFGGYLGSY